jgi:hypothetical protein
MLPLLEKLLPDCLILKWKQLYWNNLLDKCPFHISNQQPSLQMEFW